MRKRNLGLIWVFEMDGVELQALTCRLRFAGDSLLAQLERWIRLWRYDFRGR